MDANLTRRGLLAALAATSAAAVMPGAVLAGAPARSLRPVARGAAPAGAVRVPITGGAERLIAQAKVAGVTGCAVARVSDGQMLETVAGARGLPPASVLKTLTALYALEHLGPDHRFETRLVATGTVTGGRIDGDLILQGGGDPHLDTDALAGLAAALRKAGVTEVRGRFRVDDGRLPYVRTIDREQPDHLGYSPAVSGLALNFNRVHFEWKRQGQAWAVAMDARTERYRPEVVSARMTVARRDIPVYTYDSRNGIDHWTVAETALGKGGSRWLPVRNPGLYAGDVFRTLARANGVVLRSAEIDRTPPPGGQVLARHFSPPLTEILADMLKYSNNLTAEMVGLAASQAAGRAPRDLTQSGAAMADWAGRRFGLTNSRLVDHSGLGEESRLSAEGLVRALVQVRQSGVLRPLLKSFALRDAKGRTIRNHPIKVDAKTGTLNFVSGLGGFMTTADGTELAFAIFSADLDTRARIPREQRERPPGARPWNGRAKALQQDLIEHWGAAYGS